MKKVILDTDIGGDIDDAICLAYLLKEPACRLMGITTVCGEATKRAMVADAICRAAHAETLPKERKHWEIGRTRRILKKILRLTLCIALSWKIRMSS